MTQYVEKDPKLAADIIISMLKFWPISLTSKQLLFLNELEEILELVQPPEFLMVQKVLFQRVALCISCPHFQVAERTLFLWNNDYIVKLINQNRRELFPIVLGALYSNSKQHWNTAVHGLTFNVLKLMTEADPPLFDECSAANRVKMEEEETKGEQRCVRWSKIHWGGRGVMGNHGHGESHRGVWSWSVVMGNRIGEAGGAAGRVWDRVRREIHVCGELEI